jgi:hypothetical protein
MPIKKEATMSDLNAGSAVGGNGKVYIHDGSAGHGVITGGDSIDPRLFSAVADPFSFRSIAVVRPEKIVRPARPERIIINPDYKGEVIVDMSHGYLEKPASRRLIRLSKGIIKQCFIANDGSAIDYDELEWRDL